MDYEKTHGAANSAPLLTWPEFWAGFRQWRENHHLAKRHLPDPPFTCYAVLDKCEVCPGWHPAGEGHHD